MSNRRMKLSGTGKDILETLAEQLEMERPQTIQIALAKGLQVTNGEVKEDFSDDKNKWTIPDNIIKEKEFLLFKQLIINEVKMTLNDDELHEHMIKFIELGLRTLNKVYQEKTSMEDLRISIL